MARKSRKNVVETQPVRQEKVWQAALYIRLSVEFNGKRGDSLETQRQIMEAYLALCPDIEIAEIYTDNGVSGRTFERAGFQQMLADIDAGKINCVVVKDLSRLGRSAIDSGYYLEKYFPLHCVRFISVNDQYDSETADSGAHMTVPLKNMVNEAYAADISRKVRSQLHQAMQEGKFVGARPPYGYSKDPRDCHKLIVNPDTAPIVQQIFQWAAEGVAVTEIVKRLNNAHTLTPGRYSATVCSATSQYLAGAGEWQTRTVERILADEVYIGNMVQGKKKSVGHRQVPASPDEWVVVHGTHEPLVSTELFAQAQAGRQANAEKYTRTPEKPYTPNILKGRIFCGHCGKNLHRQRSKKVYFFHCLSNERISQDACKGNIGWLQEKKLFATIVSIICQKAQVMLGNRIWTQECSHKLLARREQIAKQISALQREAEQNQKYMRSLHESLVSGLLTQEEYLEMKAGYEQKFQSAAVKVQQLQEQQAKLEQQAQEYTSLAEQLARVDKDTELTAQLVDALIERITVNSADNIVINFRFENAFAELMGVLDE